MLEIQYQRRYGYHLLANRLFVSSFFTVALWGETRSKLSLCE